MPIIEPSDHWRVALGAVLALLALLGITAIVHNLLYRDRDKALVRFARRRGFTFNPGPCAFEGDGHLSFDLFAQGTALEMRNLISGEWRGLPFTAFDYAGTSRGSESEPEPQSRTVAVLPLEGDCPGVVIEPNRTSQLADSSRSASRYSVGNPKEGLACFHRRYVLMTEDDAFAGRLLHPEMETLLLEHWGIGVEIGGTSVIFSANRVLTPNEIKRLLDFAARFCELMPRQTDPASEGTSAKTG